MLTFPRMKFVVQVLVASVLGYQLFTTHGVYGIQDCKAKLDLVIILDSSLSVGMRNFKRATAFIQTLIGHLPVQPDGVRVSVVRYATDAKVISYLNESMSLEEKVHSVQTMSYRVGSTYTHVALQLTRKSVLVPERGDRPDVPNLIILTTDGASKNEILTQNEARILKEKSDVKIFVIGIGKDVADTELVNIASRPEMVYKLSDFSQLTEIVGKLAAFSCSDMKESSIAELIIWPRSDLTFISSVGTNLSVPVKMSLFQSTSRTSTPSQSPSTPKYSSKFSSTTEAVSLSTSAVASSSLLLSIAESLSSQLPSTTSISLSEYPSTPSSPSSSQSSLISTLSHFKSTITSSLPQSPSTTLPQSTSKTTSPLVTPETTSPQSTSTTTSQQSTSTTTSQQSTTKTSSQSTHTTSSWRSISLASSSSPSTSVILTSLSKTEHTTQEHLPSQTTDHSTLEMLTNDTTAPSKDVADINFDQTNITTLMSQIYNGDNKYNINLVPYRSGTIKQENISESILDPTIQTEVSRETNIQSQNMATSSDKTTTYVHNSSTEVSSDNITSRLTSTQSSTLQVQVHQNNDQSETGGMHENRRTSKTITDITPTESDIASTKSTSTQFNTQNSSLFLFTVKNYSEVTSLPKTTFVDNHWENSTSEKFASFFHFYPTLLTNRTLDTYNHTSELTNNITATDNHTISSNETSYIHTNTSILTNETTSLLNKLTSIETSTSGMLVAEISTENHHTLQENLTQRISSSKKKKYKTVNITPYTTSVTESKHLVTQADISSNSTITIHGQHGGEVSSRDLYIFVAGGSAVTVILATVGTFMTVLCRRKMSKRTVNGEV